LVHVLQVGRNEAEGYFYYVMELADSADGAPADHGRGLTDDPTAASLTAIFPTFFVAEDYRPRTMRSELESHGRLSTAACIRVGLDVVSGLAQLHAHGLVHRDIKPGNIIFVHGRAKLADIGLVSVPGEAGTFVGTAGYIAPEGPGTPAADLYALGVVLFEASTGFGPERLPEAPSEWFSERDSDSALELHEVILRACEGQRDRRYQNANEMQADLALLQSGQSIRHIRALAQRYARLRAAGFVGSALLGCAAIVMLVANYRAQLAAASGLRETALRQRAQEALALAQTAEAQVRHQLNAALFDEARALVLSKELGHRTRALEALRRVSGATNVADLRSVAFAALQLTDLRLMREVALPQDLTMAQLDARLERIALCRGTGAVTINLLPGLGVLQTLPATRSDLVFEARWASDGRFIAVKRQHDGGGARSEVEVWNLEPSPRLLRVEQEVAFTSMCFHPKRPILMLGYGDGRVKTIDLEQNKDGATFQFPDAIHALEYSPPGDRFAASYWAGTNWQLALCEAATGATVRRWECPKSSERIAWHPRGRWLSVVGIEAVHWNREVHLISPDTGAINVLGHHKVKTAMVDFSPDGDYLMTGGWDNQLLCWDLRTRQRVLTFAGSGFLQFWRADAPQYAMLLPNWRLQLFDIDRPLCVELAGNTGEGLRPGAFSPDGRWFAVPDARSLWIWELGHPSAPARLSVAGSVQPFFSPDSSKLFVVGGPIENAHLEVWELESCGSDTIPPRLISLPVTVPSRLSHAALAGDDLILTSAEGIRSVNLGNLGSGTGHVTPVPSGYGIVSADGGWLAVTYSFSPRVTLYRLPEVQRVAELETRDLVVDAAFAPFGDELAVVNRSGVEFWDTRTCRLRCQIHEQPVADSYLFYTPPGNGVWKITNFHDAALHDSRTLEKILPLPASVLPIALSGDGHLLAVSVDDERMQIWDLAKLRARFREVALDWTE
jgi:WD40 repeat protein